MKKIAQMSFIVLMLAVSACQSTTATTAETTPTAELKNTLWKLTDLGGTKITTPENQRMASLTLTSEESRARIATACNSGGAGFMVEGKVLKFTAVMSTKMGCPSEQMQQEAAFFKVIEDTASYRITGEVLELFDSGNKLLATFHSEYL